MSEYSKSLKRILKILTTDEEYDKSDYDSIVLEIPSLFAHEKELDFVQNISQSSEEDCISALEKSERLMEENEYIYPILDKMFDTEVRDLDLEFLEEDE